MEVIILIFCETGFGDQYSSLITGLNALLDLRKFKIEPKIIVSKGHKYFSPSIPLNTIYSFESFDCEIQEVLYNEVENLLIGYELLLFTSIQIWVKKTTETLNEYKLNHKHISRHNRDLFSIEFSLGNGLLNKDILEISERFIKNYNDLIGVHFRCGDEFLTSNIKEILNNDFWGAELKRAQEVIENNSDKKIYLSSLNRDVTDFFSKNYSNVIIKNYENQEIPMHNIVGVNDRIENHDLYINHSKNILSEMVSFGKCHKIWSFNTFPSNFVLYGILNNVNYEKIIDKSKISVI